MLYQFGWRVFISLFLLAALLAACAPAAQNPAPPTPGLETPAAATAPATPPQPTPTLNLTDPATFEAALVQAIMNQDTAKLRGWMTDEFLTVYWRADGSYTSADGALRELYDKFLVSGSRLELVSGSDLKALMGENDPLAMSRPDAGLVDAALVRGWGQEGRDEAVLLVARDADGSLKWHGWVIVKGGFSGARYGGAELYTNTANGFRFFYPKGFEVVETDADHVMVLAPGQGHPGQGRAAALIDVGPADGRSTEQIAEQAKADVGPGVDIPPGTAMGLDKSFAIVLSGLPGQDWNRQLFTVYNDRLYHIMFVPDIPQSGAAYENMEDLYALIINTFHYLN